MKKDDITYLKLRYGARVVGSGTEVTVVKFDKMPDAKFIKERRNLIWDIEWTENEVHLSRYYYNRKGNPRREMDDEKVLNRLLKYLIQFDRAESRNADK